MKRIISLSILLLFVFLPVLSSCGPDAQYRNDVSVSQLAEQILNSFGGSDSDFEEAESDYYTVNIGNPENLESYTILLPKQSGNFSEIGICKIKKGANASDVEKSVRAYIESQQKKLASFLSSYEPAEVEKIQNASVKIYGDYVIYFFLTKADQSRAYSAVESALKV